MNDLKRNRLEVVSWVTFAVGLMMLLNGAHSSGEALETLKLVSSLNAGTLFGVIMVLLAAAALVALLVGDIKRILKHR